MQHAFENLEQTVMFGKLDKIIVRKEDDAADAAISVQRAEGHTRAQLEMLISQVDMIHWIFCP
jgi:hypothetical protein